MHLVGLHSTSKMYCYQHVQFTYSRELIQRHLAQFNVPCDLRDNIFGKPDVFLPWMSATIIDVLCN